MNFTTNKSKVVLLTMFVVFLISLFLPIVSHADSELTGNVSITVDSIVDGKTTAHVKATQDIDSRDGTGFVVTYDSKLLTVDNANSSPARNLGDYGLSTMGNDRHNVAGQIDGYAVQIMYNAYNSGIIPAGTELATIKLNVVPNAVGTTTLKVINDTGSDRSELATASINIELPATAVKLNKSSLELDTVHNTGTLTATIEPSNSTDTISWSSSDESVVKVSGNGNTVTVTALKAGSANVIAKAGNKEATCKVTVTEGIVCEHEFETIAGKSATCTESGNVEYKKCSKCGKLFEADGKTLTTLENVTTNALGHDYSKVENDETHHWKVCSRCASVSEKTSHKGEGDVIKHDSKSHYKYCSCGVLVAENHVKGDPVKENIVSVKPDHKDKGSYDEVVYCTECKEELSRVTKEIDIEHDGSESDWQSNDENHWKECGCGVKVDEGEHKKAEPVEENIKPAGCSTEGSYDEVVYCSVCKHELSRKEVKVEATGEHTPGETVIENRVEATTSKEGSFEEVIYCIECEKEISRTKYSLHKVLEGAKSTYERNDATGITIRVDAEFSKFTGIEIDGKEVDKSNYDAKSGSTIVTLKTDYLNTLYDGEHKIAFLYNDGSKSETTFSIIPDTKVAAAVGSAGGDKTSADNAGNQGTVGSVAEPSTPKTGDSSNVSLWIIGLAISGIIFVIVVICKVRGTKRKTHLY